MTVTSTDIRALADRFGERERAAPELYPADNIADIRREGLTAAPFPAALGGRDWTLTDAATAVETIASRSPSTALLLSMPLGLAAIYALGPDAAPAEHRPRWATQIERIAEDYRSGTWYAACNSERGAGGSLAATQTVARRRTDGRFELSGEKILASSGRAADRFFSTARVDPAELPGAGVVEFFFVDTRAAGVEILNDWDGFGMRPTESHTVRYRAAAAEDMLGFPNFLETVQPLQAWFCLFAAIPLGCARGLLDIVSTPAPSSPALRLRLSEAKMRYEAAHAYLVETTRGWRAAAGPQYAARVLRMKTFVSQEATRLSADLFALAGGRHYRRSDAAARLLADSFAGTALRPPLALALDSLIENFFGHEAQ